MKNSSPNQTKPNHARGWAFFLFLTTILLLNTTFTTASYYPHNGWQSEGLGNGTFVGRTTATTLTTSQGLTNPSYSPFVADLDGNGNPEIFVLDGSSIKFYKTRNLLANASYTFNQSGTFGTPFVHDLDSDGLSELIIPQTTTTNVQLVLLNYNNGVVSVKKAFNTSFDYIQSSGETMVACTNDKCVLFSTRHENNGIDNSVSVTAFNLTSYGTNYTLQYSASSSVAFCFPRIKSVAVGDYDSDGVQEMVFSYGVVTAGGDTATLASVSVNSTNGVVVENTYSDGGLTLGTGNDCSNVATDSASPNRYFSSPIITTGVLGNTIAWAHSIDSDEYKLYSHDRNFVRINTHPNFVEPDGIILSNVFEMNFFPSTPGDTARTDYCVIGYNNGASPPYLEMTCGSNERVVTYLGVGFDSVVQRLNISGSLLSSFNTGRNIMLSHSAQHSSVLVGGKNLDEVVTPYGVLYLSSGTASFNPGSVDNYYDMNMGFTNAFPNGSITSADGENVGYDDLLVLTPQALYYIDDQFTNDNAFVNSVQTNPCSDQPVRYNTTLGITTVCSDAVGDLVSAQACVYTDYGFARCSGWSANYSSETPITFTFSMNETVANSQYTVYCKDNKHTTNTSYSAPLSFATTGNVYGESSCTETFEETSTNASGIVEVSDDNIITHNVGLLGVQWGLGSFLTYIILMGVLAVLIAVIGHQHGLHVGLILILIMIVEIIAFIIGIVLGIIPVWVLIVGVILALLMIVGRVMHWFSIGGNGGTGRVM